MGGKAGSGGSVSQTGWKRTPTKRKIYGSAYHLKAHNETNLLTSMPIIILGHLGLVRSHPPVGLALQPSHKKLVSIVL